MNSSILLINLPGKSIRKVEENCGLALLKSYLESKNVKTDILDAYALHHSIENTKSIIANWISSNITTKHCIGIAPYVTSFDELIEIGNYIKNIDNTCDIYLGGHFATLNKEYLLEHYSWIDGIVVGEGELTLYDLVRNDYRHKNILGFYCKKYRKSFKQRPRIDNLDVFPFQARYLTPEQLDNHPFSITTSRGCYGQCSFCSISEFYRNNTPNIKQTYRSAKTVANEIHLLNEKYSIKSLKIVDDNFFRDNSDGFLIELISLLKNVNISFRLSARPNDITINRAKLLHKLGVSVVGIGVESADEESLKIYKKGISLKDSENAIQYLNKYNISCLVNFIMFNPIITLTGLKKNVAFVSQHRVNTIYHRINSHLWIRSTDPIASYLQKIGLCKKTGFPYLVCNYKYDIISEIRKLFDRWCNFNMKQYYQYADILMAQGISGHESVYNSYNNILNMDLFIINKLIEFTEDGSILEKGNAFIERSIKNWS